MGTGKPPSLSPWGIRFVTEKGALVTKAAGSLLPLRGCTKLGQEARPGYIKAPANIHSFVVWFIQ